MLVRRWLDAAGIDDPLLRRCYLACARYMVDRDGQIARFAARSLPLTLRPYPLALAALLAVADDRSDTGDRSARQGRLAEWAQATYAAAAEGHSEHPILHAAADTVHAWQLDLQPLEDYFAALRRDVDFTEFATYEELRWWTSGFAGAQLRLGWPLLGLPGTTQAAAPVLAQAGELMQLGDILWDLATDLRQGRLYLPLEDLDRFGVRPQDLFAGRWSPPVAELIAFEVGRVRPRLQQVAAELTPLTHPAARPALRKATAYALLSVQEICARGGDLLRRPVLPTVLRGVRAWQDTQTGTQTDKVSQDAPIPPLRPPGSSRRIGPVVKGKASMVNSQRVWSLADAQRSRVASIEAELDQWLGHERDLFAKICRDALFPSGKLLRPVLCLESAGAVGGDVAAVVPFAATLEGVHVATLIHDDIIDQDPVRRGRASAPEQYGIAEALLAGDGLIVLAITAMLQTRNGLPAERVMQASRIVLAAMEQMCRAALREMLIRGDLGCGVQTGLDIIRGKTASLMGAACRAGGILAGAPAPQVDTLDQYGNQLGMAFQIRDDLLPYAGDEHVVGKSAVSDVANAQPTLPILLGHARAGTADSRRLTQLLTATADSVAAHRELTALLTRTGALTQAAHLARTHAQHARDALTGLPPSANRDRLAELTATIVDRDH